MRRSNRVRIVLLVAPTIASIAPTVANALWPEPAGEVVRGDFDNDGAIDIVVSSPEDDCSKGRIYVVEPSSGTVTAWTRDTSGVLGTATCGDLFGAALAVGDFDGDDYDDIAVGAPGADDSGVSDAGAVHVLYGSSSGLTATGDQVWHQDSTGISGEAETEDDFGSVLSTADFDCDGYSDLVVSAPMEDVNVPEAGAVHVLYGSSGGVSNVNDFYRQGVGGVGGASEEDDHFGASVVAGNYNGDENSGRDCDDLTIGAPDDEIDTVLAAGRTWTFYGGTAGLSTTGSLGLHQNVSGVTDSCQTSDRFSARLETTDSDNDGYDDLLVIIPGDGCVAGVSVGRHVFYGGSGGLVVSGNELTCEDYTCEAFATNAYSCRSYAPPVWGTAANETLELFVGDDVAWGEAGADTFHGDHGDDVLFGGDGNDKFDGAAGLDILMGGDGNDTFIVDADCEVVAGEVIDGGPGTDTIRSHLTLAQLGSAGVSVRSIEQVVTIAEQPAGDDHCLLVPFEEGPYTEPVVTLSWDDLPDSDSVFTTRQGILDLSVDSTAEVSVSVDLTFELLVRGQSVEQTATVTLGANGSTTVELDLAEFIPTGVDPQTVEHSIPTSATITAWGTIEAGTQPFGRTFAPLVYGHIEAGQGGGEDAVLYREDALHSTYNHGDLAHAGSQADPWQGVRLQRVEATGSLGIPGY